MRLRACMGGLLLAATGCAGLPEQVRLEVDGRALEVRQNGLAGVSEEDAAAAERAKTPLNRCPK